MRREGVPVSRDTAPAGRNLQRRGAAEFIEVVFHGYTITHVDTPAHYLWNGKMYNGRSCNLVTAREGPRSRPSTCCTTGS